MKTKDKEIVETRTVRFNLGVFLEDYFISDKKERVDMLSGFEEFYKNSEDHIKKQTKKYVENHKMYREDGSMSIVLNKIMVNF